MLRRDAVGVIVLTLVGLALRLPSVGTPLYSDMHGYRQSQTAFTIRGFASRGIDLWHPWLPIFGPPWQLAFELPLFQAMATPLVWMGLSASTAGRALNLAFFLLSGVLLWILVRRIAGNRAALIALVLFQVLPFGVEWGVASLIEFMTTAACLGMLLCLMNVVAGHSLWWTVPAVLCSIVAFTVKVTTAVPWCIVVLAVVVTALRSAPRWRGWVRPLASAAVVVGVGVLLGELWTAHADRIKEANPYERALTSKALTEFNFGTWEQRGTWDRWWTVLERVTELMSGPWPFLVVLTLLAVTVRRNRLLVISLVLVPVIAVVTFFSLYWRHSYYLSAVFPAIAAAFGIAVDRLASLAAAWLARRGRSVTPHVAWAVVVAVVATMLATTWTSTQGRQYASFMGPKGPPQQLIQELRTTPRDAEIIMFGCSYDSRFLFTAHRRGLMILPAYRRPATLPPHPFRRYDYVGACGAGHVGRFLTRRLYLEQVSTHLYRIRGFWAHHNLRGYRP